MGTAEELRKDLIRERTYEFDRRVNSTFRCESGSSYEAIPQALATISEEATSIGPEFNWVTHRIESTQVFAPRKRSFKRHQKRTQRVFFDNVDDQPALESDELSEFSDCGPPSEFNRPPQEYHVNCDPSPEFNRPPQ